MTDSNNYTQNVRIWKISHGKSGNMTEDDHELLINHHVVAIGYAGSHPQGKKFQEIKSGDYFYLVRNATIILLGQFKGDKASTTPQGFSRPNWTSRKFELIKKVNFKASALKKEYNNQKGWQPSGYNTVFMIPNDALLDFEAGILDPVFKMTLNDLKVAPDQEKSNISSPNNFTPNKSSLNQILYGPPGTGKTFNTIIEAIRIIDPSQVPEKISDDAYTNIKADFEGYRNSNRIDFVTFHQSFSYEDFVEGIRANTDSEKLTYKIEDGILKTIAQRAERDPENNYVLIIDEINRGNISRVFGELITTLEPSKRLGEKERLQVKLPYSKTDFGVPKNLYIIGTMNTADRSLALMDTALRRRFDFIEMMPQPELLSSIQIDGINIQKLLEAINQNIEAVYDREHTIGHAFFMELKDKPTMEDLERIFKNKILPLLEEYFFEDWENITKVLGESDFYQSNTHGTRKTYSRNVSALKNADSYKRIYTNADESE